MTQTSEATEAERDQRKHWFYALKNLLKWLVKSSKISLKSNEQVEYVQQKKGGLYHVWLLEGNPPNTRPSNTSKYWL